MFQGECILIGGKQLLTQIKLLLQKAESQMLTQTFDSEFEVKSWRPSNDDFSLLLL